MDVETRDAIETLRVDLTGEIVVVRLDLTAEITAVRQEMHALEERLRADFRKEIKEEGAITRRHFDIVVESLRDDIKLIAEGLVSLDAKVESMRCA